MTQARNGFATVTLDSLETFLRGSSISKSDLTASGIGVVLYGELYTTFDGVIDRPRSFASPSIVNGSPKLKFGDILFPTAGESAEEIGKPSVYLSVERAHAGGDLIIFRPSNPDLGEYLVSSLRTHEAFAYRYKMGQGQSIVHINQAALENHPVKNADIETASSIARVRQCWDRGIGLANRLICAKQAQMHAMLQRLGTRVGNEDIVLAGVLRRINTPVSPETGQLYREIGIRSHGKGLFHKEPVTGRSLGNKRVYRLKPNCFVFNVVFAWEQAVARTTEQEKNMIASHRFPMYEPIDDGVDIDYLLYFFKSFRGKHLLGLASPGGAGRNRTLSQDAFMKLKIPLPEIEEQRRIARLLIAADREIDLLKAIRDFYRKQKKGLMQQLLTGKVRMKAPEGVA